MISVKDLSFSYGDKEIFNGFSYEFSNRITSISAPSGYGKTTLLRIIGGLEKDYHGTVSGVPDKVSFMFQEDRLLPWFTAEQNIAAVLPKDKRGLVKEYLEAVELSDCARSFPHELSGGQQRRVSLARALAYGGKLLLLDEPFKGFDPELTERMAALIVGSGATVIASLHSRRESELLGGESVFLSEIVEDTPSSPDTASC